MVDRRVYSGADLHCQNLGTLFLLLLLHAGSVHADPFDPAKLQGLGDTRYHQFESETLGYFLDWKGGPEMPLEATRLFVSEGEFNDRRFKQPATEWIEYWSDPGRKKPFVLEVQILSGQSHLSSVTESFRQGLRWLLPD